MVWAVINMLSMLQRMIHFMESKHQLNWLTLLKSYKYIMKTLHHKPNLGFQNKHSKSVIYVPSLFHNDKSFMNFDVFTQMNVETPSLKTETAGSSKMLLTIYWTIQSQIQKAADIMKHFNYPPPKMGARIAYSV